MLRSILLLGSQQCSSSTNQILRYYARGRHPTASSFHETNSRTSSLTADRRSTNYKRLNDVEHDDPDDSDPTDYGRHEADFNQLAHSHRSHRQEMMREREDIKHRIVGAKYFRHGVANNAAQPQSNTQSAANFLTWSEKQQMRRLHANDPTEWPIERLAAAFPADEAAVVKVVRAHWTPRDAERVARHDRAVQRAWQVCDWKIFFCYHSECT